VLAALLFFLAPGQLCIHLFQFRKLSCELLHSLAIVVERVLRSESSHPKARLLIGCRDSECLICGEWVHGGLAGRRLGSSRYFYLRRLLVLNFHIILIFSDN